MAQATISGLTLAAFERIRVPQREGGIVKSSMMFSAAAAVWILSSPSLDARGVDPSPPNVLLIVLDDVGVERLGFYGATTPVPTPELDALRQMGVLFTNAYSNPLCSPTRAALQSGRYAFRTGIGKNVGGSDALALGESTIAELLKAGFPGGGPQYTCGAFGKWHLTMPPDYMHPIDQGYDRYVGSFGNQGPPAHQFFWTQVAARPQGYTLTTIGTELDGPFDESTYMASVMRSQTLAWIGAQSQPFFAYVCFVSPEHTFQVPPFTLVSDSTKAEILALNYRPGKKVATEHIPKAYDWWLEAVDTEIGNLLEGIDPLQLANTTILIVGDNGTPTHAVEPPFDPNHAKSSVYQLGTHVPLLVAGSHVSDPNSTCTGLVGATDFWHTIADVSGAQILVPGGDDSLSFEHMIEDPSAASARTKAFVQKFIENGAYVPDPDVPAAKNFHDRGMTDGTFKYIRKWSGSTLVEEAYKLSVDPQETNDLWPILDTLPPAERIAILQLRHAMIALSGA